MSVRTLPSAMEPIDEAPSVVRWRIWPIVDRPIDGVPVLALLAAVGLGTLHLTGLPHLAALAVGMIVLAMWRFFVPVTFEVNADGVHQSVFGSRQWIPWSAIRSHEVRQGGVLLLPCPNGCPLDALRGLYVPWGECRKELLAQIHYHLERTMEV